MADFLKLPTDAEAQRCLKCGEDALDTGWECTECGYDNMPWYYPQGKALAARHEPKDTER
jgi:ribosomal protein L37E